MSAAGPARPWTRVRFSETVYALAATRRSYSRSSSHCPTSQAASALTPRSSRATRSLREPPPWREATTRITRAGTTAAATPSTRTCLLMLSKCKARSRLATVSCQAITTDHPFGMPSKLGFCRFPQVRGSFLRGDRLGFWGADGPPAGHGPVQGIAGCRERRRREERRSGQVHWRRGRREAAEQLAHERRPEDRAERVEARDRALELTLRVRR